MHWDVCTIFSFIDSDMLHNLVSEDGLVDHSVDKSLPVPQGGMDTDPRHPRKDPLSASLTPGLGVWGGEAEGLCSSVSTSLVGNSKENKAEEL